MWRARCESHAVVADFAIARLSARVRELESGRTEADAARKASTLRARAMRSEAEAEYDRRAAARSAACADDIARRYAMDVLAAADEAARARLPALEAAAARARGGVFVQQPKER